MRLSKRVQRTLMASAVAVLAFGAAPAMAATVDTPFGSCAGDATHDCVTATGHASASMVTTLTINEQRAISFGNMSITSAAGGDSTVKLGTNSSRTVTNGTDTITLLHGAQSSNGAGNAASGAQSAGHYTVETAAEGGATQVYISFADTSGNIIDMCTPGGVCDAYHPGNKVTLAGPGAGTEHLFMDKFVINESGSDVYGHYIDNAGGAANPSPGIANPFDHSHTAAADIDVVVGATLHTDSAHVAGAYGAGKYVGTFNAMVSY
jgi:hypothetical protein